MTGNWLKEDACDMLLSWQVTCGTFEESSCDKTCDTPMWLPGVALKWVWWNELWWRGMRHDLRCLLKNNLIDRSEISEHPIWSQDLELCQCLLLVVLTFVRIGERKGEDSAGRLKKILLRPEKRLDDVCLSIICRGKIIHGDDLIRSKWIIQDDLKLSLSCQDLTCLSDSMWVGIYALLIALAFHCDTWREEWRDARPSVVTKLTQRHQATRMSGTKPASVSESESRYILISLISTST